MGNVHQTVDILFTEFTETETNTKTFQDIYKRASGYGQPFQIVFQFDTSRQLVNQNKISIGISHQRHFSTFFADVSLSLPLLGLA